MVITKSFTCTLFLLICKASIVSEKGRIVEIEFSDLPEDTQADVIDIADKALDEFGSEIDQNNKGFIINRMASYIKNACDGFFATNVALHRRISRRFWCLCNLTLYRFQNRRLFNNID